MIKPENMPGRDLRDTTRLLATHQPNPDAVAKFKRFKAGQHADPKAALLARYPSAAVAQAAIEREKESNKARRLVSVFTADVVAVWRELLAEGKTVEWLAEHNGLVATSPITIKKYMRKFKNTKTAVSPPPNVAAQHAAPPSPAAAPVQTPAAPTDVALSTAPDTTTMQLAADAAQINDQLTFAARLIEQLQSADGVQVSGSFTLSLNISAEF